MKKIVIACGTGIATSTMVKDRVETILRKNGVPAKIIQCTLNEVDGYDGDVDLIITWLLYTSRGHGNRPLSRRL